LKKITIFDKITIGDNMQNLGRLELITTKEKIEKIKNTNILLIGLGGVGGYTFETLVRSGIENITIVDGDTFEESNLNRQLLSLTSTINTLSSGP
jgi:tRNA A37 threonylcarbamoyladenosine dehydratase